MGRKLPPVIGQTDEETADYGRVRQAREAGCVRACGGYEPTLPICTKCFVNLHAGKWHGDTQNGRFVFGYGDSWQEMLDLMSQVHGWIKPDGVAQKVKVA